MKLFSFRGGVHPESRKDRTSEKPVEDLALSRDLHVPLRQHMGAPAEPVIHPGDQVSKGQILAVAQGTISAPVHAPTSGTVIEVGEHLVPHPSGLPGRAIAPGDQRGGVRALPHLRRPHPAGKARRRHRRHAHHGARARRREDHRGHRGQQAQGAGHHEKGGGRIRGHQRGGRAHPIPHGVRKAPGADFDRQGNARARAYRRHRRGGSQHRHRARGA